MSDRLTDAELDWMEELARNPLGRPTAHNALLALVAEVREHRAREAAHRAAPPEPDPRESLPDETPVGHGWVTARRGRDLFRPCGYGRFTWWLETPRGWGQEAHWHESGVYDPRPATVGDLRRVGVPVTEWPAITAPEPEAEPVEPPDGSVVLVNGVACQRTLDCWYAAGQRMVRKWSDLLTLGTPTVIHRAKP